MSTGADALLDEARSGTRAALARLLTYVESGGPAQRETAALVYLEPAPFVVGVTGPPGSGKSTLCDRLITTMLGRGALGEGLAVNEIAVLCVDPTSPVSGGAILGDRVRMQAHATDDRVFIRSMATRGHLGGLALAVPDAIRVLGATGFSLTLLETVGVGQIEVEVASAADTTVVVTAPGWGDSMQANKAGLLEVADIFVINKADRAGVREAHRDLEQMLELGRPRPWRPPVIETTATEGEGVDALVDALDAHRTFLGVDGLAAARRARSRAALDRVVAALVHSRVVDVAHEEKYEAAVTTFASDGADPYTLAEGLLA